MSEFEPIMSEKLTKKFLMDLDEGLYLISNVTDNFYKPIFSEKVVPLRDRDEQWKRIKTLEVNHRLCEVFKSKKIYEEYHFKSFLNGLMG